MRRVAFPYLLALALLPALPPSATAVGLNLRWNACGAEGVSSLAFACNTNTGSDRLVGSYVAPNGITQLMGTEMILFATFSGTGVPSWWQMKNAGTCRQTALTMSLIPDPAWTVCTDYWQGQALGGIGAYTIGYPTLSSVRISLAAAVPNAAMGPLTAGTEYFDFSLLISHAKTVGTGACAGCTTPACLLLQSIKLVQPAGLGDYFVTNPVSPNSHVVTWQSGAPISCVGTPARNGTWGSVKSLYR